MFERLGIVGFLGNLVPGAYLADSIIITIFCIVIAEANFTLKTLIETLSKNTIVFSSAFLLFAYLLGVIMRLIGPNRIDNFSSFYFRKLRLKKVNSDNLWMFEEFPYRFNLSKTFKKGGMEKVISLMKKLNVNYSNLN